MNGLQKEYMENLLEIWRTRIRTTHGDPWIRKSDLKGCTKALICSAQEQSIRTNYIEYNIDKTGKSPFCGMCDTKNETISHIVSECCKLAQKEYKRRHDIVGRYVHWWFSEKLGFSRARL